MTQKEEIEYWKTKAEYWMKCTEATATVLAERDKEIEQIKSPVSVIEDSKADFYEYGQSLEIKINDLQRLRSRYTITKKSQSTPIEVKP